MLSQHAVTARILLSGHDLPCIVPVTHLRSLVWAEGIWLRTVQQRLPHCERSLTVGSPARCHCRPALDSQEKLTG